MMRTGAPSDRVPGCGRLLLGLLLLAVAPAADARAEPDTCVTCHLEEEAELPDKAELDFGAGVTIAADFVRPVAEWRDSVHAAHAVSCDACHGGDPHEPDADLSMSEEAGFLDNPSWSEMADFCGVCHEAIAERYSAGEFGEAIEAGVLVASCATCHMPQGHRIVEAVPGDLDYRRRCSSCLPFPGVDFTITSLEKAEATAREARTRVAEAESRGIALRDLRQALKKVRTDSVEALHAFDPESLDRVLAEADSRYGEISDRALGFRSEADRRRRLGAAVVAVLMVLLGALVVYPARSTT